MNPKEEFKKLVDLIKSRPRAGGGRWRNEDIAHRLRLNPNYFSTLTGKSGIVTDEHIDHLKEVFADELAGIVREAAKSPDSIPDTAVLYAMLEDYAERVQKMDGTPKDEVLKKIRKRAHLFAGDLRKFFDQ